MSAVLRHDDPAVVPSRVHTAADLRHVAATLNKRPRPTLGLETPADRLNKLLTAA